MIRLSQTFGAHTGRTKEFDQDVITFGRLPTSDVAFDPHADLDASGAHAEVRREGGQWVLVDAKSRNGTLVRGQTITRHVLATGDEIEFGTGGPRIRVEIVEASRPASVRPAPSPPARGVPTVEATPIEETHAPKLYGQRTLDAAVEAAAARAAASVAAGPLPGPGPFAPPYASPPHGNPVGHTPPLRAPLAMPSSLPSAPAPMPMPMPMPMPVPGALPGAPPGAFGAPRSGTMPLPEGARPQAMVAPPHVAVPVAAPPADRSGSVWLIVASVLALVMVCVFCVVAALAIVVFSSSLQH